ncbi:MAG: xanthine dehydrogenase family protein subunit M [Ignavibacteriae bacterium]|nr:xanthine dehydrogenase family protein subunit M [Ignavibacteriota bacterium]NOG96453.1 xanthine dehydrogenase family protein subunit M [Ignavibacteriota bacterium]
MKDFNYIQPDSLSQAGKYLSNRNNDAVILSGGTDLLSLIKENIYTNENVVNLKTIPNLNNIKYKKGEGLTIGALTKISDVAESKIIKEKFTVLAEAAKEIASLQLRNMGTVGGNICQRPRCWYYREDFDCIKKGGGECFAYQGENKYHCIIGGGPCYIVHPSDLAVALTALDAKVKLFFDDSSRIIPIHEFFILPEDDYLFENILRDGEIVTEIIIPDLPDGAKSSYIKIKERETWDFAVVSAAAVISKKGSNIKSGKIAYGGVAPIPWTEEIINKSLKNLNADKNEIEKISKIILADAEPLEKNKYKVILAKNLVKRILTNLVLDA